MPLISVPGDRSGRRQGARTREPGDLPSLRFRAGRGASATVELLDCPFRTPELCHSGVMRMSDIGPAGRATVMVCITCRSADTLAADTLAADTLAAETLGAEAPRAGMLLAEATGSAAAAVRGVSVLRIRCLGNCSRGPSAAIRCDSSWTYIFGGLEPDRDATALIIGAQLLAQAADGIMPWRGRPESLKRGLIARVPPADFREEST